MRGIGDAMQFLSQVPAVDLRVHLLTGNFGSISACLKNKKSCSPNPLVQVYFRYHWRRGVEYKGQEVTLLSKPQMSIAQLTCETVLPVLTQSKTHTICDLN